MTLAFEKTFDSAAEEYDKIRPSYLPAIYEDILQYRVMRQAEWEILPKAVSLFCEERIRIIGNKTEIL